ncbi:hypothetical protein [Halapricum salinum]|uniref:Uncharacterized protein n=1 Tax=Halapricum salinum TaxID=1457250 RepID=A0A4D6H8G4_9EURY|nr:hypothetical protein [Halapricum salinum]QCC50119.1 hypothetical protein DV733_02255 [Halapricum salinum]
MSDRRTVLKVLGLGAVGAGAAYSTGVFDSSSQESTSIDSPAEMRAAVADVAPDQTTPYAPVAFDYEPIDVTVDDPYFNRVVAEPAADGDLLRIDQTNGEPAVVLAVLRGIWTIGTDETVEATVGSETVTLAGGSSPTHSFAALLGLTSLDGRQSVVVVRGQTVEDARELATDLESIGP